MTEVRKIRIENDNCVPEIDTWLLKNVGIGNWSEWIGFTALPYRSFSFKKEEHETLFILRWL